MSWRYVFTFTHGHTDGYYPNDQQAITGNPDAHTILKIEDGTDCTVVLKANGRLMGAPLVSLDDLLEDLFDAIDAIPDAPDLEQIGPSDVARFAARLQVAVTELGARERLFSGNARVALPDWETHGTITPNDQEPTP